MKHSPTGKTKAVTSHRFSLRLAGVLLMCSLLTGCMSNQHVIGLGPTGLGETSARQYYILFGFVEFNDVDAQRMADELTSYTIQTEFSFVDALLLPLLLPFTVTSRTVTVKT